MQKNFTFAKCVFYVKKTQNITVWESCASVRKYLSVTQSFTSPLAI